MWIRECSSNTKSILFSCSHFSEVLPKPWAPKALSQQENEQNTSRPPFATCPFPKKKWHPKKKGSQPLPPTHQPTNPTLPFLPGSPSTEGKMPRQRRHWHQSNKRDLLQPWVSPTLRPSDLDDFGHQKFANMIYCLVRLLSIQKALWVAKDYWNDNARVYLPQDKLETHPKP